MNKQRSVVLAFTIMAVLLISGLMIYGEVQTARTKFLTGQPPEEIKKALQPRQVDLSQLRPPALRAAEMTRYGSATSVASVIEFGDYECEACREVKKTIDAVVPKFGGRVRFVWRDLPVQDVNPHAFEAALVARCAAAQGKFWNAHDALFDASRLGESVYASIAVNLDLNLSAFARCRQDAQLRSALQADIDTARNDGINSVPLLFLGTKAHQGAISPEELERELTLFLAS